jgi:hypothetical protein
MAVYYIVSEVSPSKLMTTKCGLCGHDTYMVLRQRLHIDIDGDNGDCTVACRHCDCYLPE